MPTEPHIPTLSEVVRRAAEATDPGNDAVEEFQERTEDVDEPVTAFDDIDEWLAEVVGRIDPEGEDPVMVMTAAVAVYLGPPPRRAGGAAGPPAAARRPRRVRRTPAGPRGRVAGR